ncbi:MAG: transposase [Oscillatoriophycideae cyanobacterium NC_groundwater_1537_Pr4_S-0.65um_50_18]|nr:transposase [Oscillatoriophycideae cyanobacterium NC_groundwater_1537_Pr4_S-0.65um_50_18]
MNIYKGQQEGKTWFSPSELAGLPGMPRLRENVARKAKAEGWRSRKRSGKGGGQEYAFESLPEATKTALISIRNIQGETSPLEENQAVKQVLPQTDTTASIPYTEEFQNSIPEAEKIIQTSRLAKRSSDEKKADQRTDAWIEILKAYEHWRKLGSHFPTVEVCQIEFCNAYNRQALALFDWVYQAVPLVSKSTLNRKNRIRKTDTVSALGGKYGNRKQKGRIDSDEQLQKDIEVCISAGGRHWGASLIHELLLLEFGYDPEELSVGQVRAWIRKFRIENPIKWQDYMDPGRAKGTVYPAFGSRSMGVERPNQIWEVDSINVGVKLKYEVAGSIKIKRVAVVACVDLYTRLPMILVSETSKADAICLLLAMAILKFGVPEAVRTDRGRDYISHKVQRFLANLGVETEGFRCLPFHPEQKAFIERFNRTFQHRYMATLPLFLGYSVEDQKAIRNRNGKDEKIIELAMDEEKFQQWCDKWCDKYAQKSHGRPGVGLEGKSPLEMLEAAVAEGWEKRIIEDPRELDFLMMSAPGKGGTRKVGREGISLKGRLYVASKLVPLIGKRVFVTYSPKEPEHIYIYRSSDLKEFVCKATWEGAKGLDLAKVARDARIAFEKILQEIKLVNKRGQALRRKLAEDPLSVLGDFPEKLINVPSTLHEYPALKAIRSAILGENQQESHPQISPEEYHAELARLEAEEAQKEALKQVKATHNMHLEELLEVWRQDANIAAISSEISERVRQHIGNPEGATYLKAITDSKKEEQQFRAWLAGEKIESKADIDPDKLLSEAIAAWISGNQEITSTHKELVKNYIQQYSGKGALKALLEDYQDHHRFRDWLENALPV